MTLKRAADIMTHPVITVRPDEMLIDAIRALLRHHVSGLPVVAQGGEMVGIITERDIMNFAFSGNAAETRVEEAMTRDVVSMPPDAEMAALVDCLSGQRFRRVPIVEGGKVIGIVSRRDILREMLFMYSRYY